MRSLSVRLRLALWYSSVLLLGLVLFGTAMWMLLEHRLMAGVDAVLEQRVRGVITTLQFEANVSPEQLRIELAEFAREIPEGALIELRDERRTVLLPFSDPAGTRGLSPGSPGLHTVRLENRRYRVLRSRISFAGHVYDAVTASDLAGVDSLLRDFGRSLLLTIPLVLLVAAAGGYWVSRRALVPVDEITRVARSITVQNLSRRLPVPPTGDELQRMSEAWNEVLQRLDSAVKRITRFTADASHELRTPLALIRATAELALRRERTAAEYQLALRQIQSEAETMSEIAESLLTLARADANAAGIPLAVVDVSHVISSAVAQAGPMAVQRCVALRIEIGPEDPHVVANEPALQRLLLILLDNALKYTPSGGSVQVSAQRDGGGMRLTVSDTGEGIPADALPHIFERFYRADPVRANGSGAGLGLSIAQTIARAHGSVITAESEPGRGARFTFTLPPANGTASPHSLRGSARDSFPS